MGPSGSGKSTLMQCVAGLDRLTSGSAFIGDTELSGLNKTELTLLRRDRLGFIFQQYNLIPTLLGEGEHPPAADPRRRGPRRRRGSTTIVETVGLGDRLENLPEPALGRPAAAGRGGARARAAARHRLRRRADRRARLRAPASRS